MESKRLLRPGPGNNNPQKEKGEWRMKAKDRMTENPLFVEENMTVENLCILLAEKRVTGVPVVDRQSRLIGMVSKDDILYSKNSTLGRDRSPLNIEDLFKVGYSAISQEVDESASRTVSEIMTWDVISADEESSIEKVCELMISHHIHRIPILKESQLVGIVSSLDIVREVMTGGID
jgi:CBS domain-containing protein